MTMLCETLSKCLQAKRNDFPKTLVFCHTISECASFYQTMVSKLGKDFTNPPGYPDCHCFRVIDMYTRATSISMKKKVLASFATANSKLKIVVAINAFSIGIDCPDIPNIIHFYGPPASIEQYAQETGRPSRDGLPATALLLYDKPGKHTQPKMISYGNNSVMCCCKYLFKHFMIYDDIELGISKCNCCDVTAKKCDCNDCSDCILPS